MPPSDLDDVGRAFDDLTRVATQVVATARTSSRPPPGPPAGMRRLRVVIDGSWFEHAPGERIFCFQRVAARRLLGHLAHARCTRPGRATSAGDLIVAGWPGERLRVASALNRLRVTLSWLRTRGLGDALVSTPSGYLLDPALVDVTLLPPGYWPLAPEKGSFE